MYAKQPFYLIGVASVFLITGCGTTHNFVSRPDGPRIYGGVAFDLEMVHPDNSCKGLGVVFGSLDLPLSFVLDTATLPITAFCELLGCRRSEGPTPKEPTPEDR